MATRKKKPLPIKSKKAVPRGTWQLQTAKARLSDVIRRARTSGPQTITKNGRKEAVIVAFEDFTRMKKRNKQSQTLVEFFARSPLAQAEVSLERASDYGRVVEL